ncbi:hypothetical protein STEG23_031870, partial [Scotinomys teguina]
MVTSSGKSHPSCEAMTVFPNCVHLNLMMEKIEGQLGCFLALAIMNNAAMNI